MFISKAYAQEDTSDTDLRFPVDDQWSDEKDDNFRLDEPSNVNTDLEYDPQNQEYKIERKMGDIDYDNPRSMSLEDYLEYDMEESIDEYWNQKKQAQQINRSDGGFKPSLEFGGKVFDRIFGGNNIDIRPQGSAELTFGVNVSKTENPQIPEKQRKITTFDFDQKIQLNVVGKIGDKLKLKTNYNTESQFDFENQMKLEYTGYEDEIIKKIEAGNVSLPIKGSLISGSQSLFGIKTKLQFGRLKVTSVFSQQKGEKKEIEVSGGAQTKNFEFKADEYEENQHYFLAHYFRDNYNDAMSNLPVVKSGIDITKIEVWVTNKNNSTENTRNIVAFTDLGESETQGTEPNISPNIGIQDTNNFQLPFNDQNNVYDKVSENQQVRGFFNASSALSNMTSPGPFEPAQHYEKVENARKLSQDEYTFNRRLGFVSLNQSLDQDEVLAVAFQYTFQGETYQVGEFSTDGVSGQDALVLKLLKSTNTNTRNPIWDLMMKNVYSINAYQMNKKNFDLRVLYNDPKQGVDINFIPQKPIDGTPLIQVLNADQLDQNNRPNPDGVFDFVDNAASKGGTVNSANGKIYFPVVEPFGDNIRRKLEKASVDNNIIQNIAYEPLYDSTITAARQIPELNRFTIRGTYESSVGSEISLNAMNIPEGSVKVTAGGVKLQEGKDYTVDYTLGRVKILNEGLLQSQTPIKVSLESNSLFNVQSKRLMGSRFDYRVSDKLNLGATVLNLTERPLTQKINIGDEPINNTMIGGDLSYQTESQYLTKLVDKLPLLDTKKKSNISFNAEYARLIPGHARAIGDEGTSYIDDFEGSQSAIDIRSITRWKLASTPQGQPDLFPEGSFNNDLRYNYNRAKLAWYVIDPLFFRNNNLTPDHIQNDPDMQSDHRMREVLEQEVFPNKELPQGTPPNIAVLDLAYYPTERGPYNYDTDGSSVSQGLNPDGSLEQPESRWGGIMRKLQTTDFEQSNIEYIQFWLMDPFNSDSKNQSGGNLYFNLGNISEDILRDSRKAFENGMPSTSTADPNKIDSTEWGRVPTTQSIVNSFANDPSTRKFQDIGLDGLDNDMEQSFHGNYLSDVQNVVNSSAYQEIAEDPSADDYNYYRDDDYDQQELNILERYKEYNGLEGNSPTSEQSEEMNSEGYPTSATTRPDAEDIDQDNNLNETESYYQYKVSLKQQDLEVGENYITDKRTAYPNVPNGDDKKVTWYQFKIPVREFTKRVNNIQDFRSIRFMRMFVRGFQQPVVLRFARLELIRGDWRRYSEFQRAQGEYIQDDPPETSFNISAVNIEENGNRDPINYVIPPGIQREVNNQTTNLSKLNEQSLVLETCNLQDGDARAAYRNLELDVRNYKKLKMFTHMESPEEDVSADDVTIFIRLGTDFNQNYYEYEMPLKPTAHGDNAPNEVWPEENRMEMAFQDLLLAKKKRNALVSEGQITYNEEYTLTKGDRRITVVGTPNLAEVKTVMVGLRNPGQQKDHPWKPDDGLSKCFEVWINELRLSDFEESGGWAATANLNAELADLGNVSVSGNISTPGFGGLEDKINDRQREKIKRIDASSNINLGEFFPEKSGVKIPMYVGYSEGVEEPQFDPLNPDIKFDSSLTRLSDAEQKKKRHKSVTYTKRRSINFTNVRKQKGKNSGPARFYDVSNFSLSYSYNEQFLRDINTQYNTRKNYSGGLNYNFSPKPNNVQPFKNVKLFGKSDYFDLIQDFNFYTGPQQISFNTTMDRSYQEQQTRTNTDAIAPPRFNKDFQWNRIYNVKWDLSKNLGLDYKARNQALIGEPQGRVDMDRKDSLNDPYGPGYNTWRDSVITNIQNMGENTSFDQTINASYKLPLDKLPLTDWITANTQYSANYNWQRAPFAQDDTLGNMIQNSRKISVNGKLNMEQLYNKVGFLKKVNKKFGGRGGGRSRRRRGRGRGNGDKNNEDKKEEDEDNGKTILDYALYGIMSVKNVSVTFSQNEGTMLPGYDQQTYMVGMNDQFDAPGPGFILGEQDEDFARRMAEEENLKRTYLENREHKRTMTQNINMRATVEPVPRLRIRLNASRKETENYQDFFRWDSTAVDPEHPDGNFVAQSPQTTGSLSMSVVTFRTAFSKSDSNNISEIFQQFQRNRVDYSEQWGEEHPNSNPKGGDTAYYEGYGPTSQKVVIPAFLSAYMGKNPSFVNKNPFKVIPKPNWQVTYDGLTRIDFFQEYFRSFSIGHGYRSTMSISNYQTNLEYHDNNNDGFADENARNQAGDYIAERQINTITISESFSPLFKIDMTWKNSLISKFEIKKSRNLSFSLANNQLTEVKSTEYTFGGGYSFKDVKLPFTLMGNELKSDLKFRADLSIRDNKSYTRKMVEDQNEITSGQKVISIKTSLDYVISQRLNIRLFYDRVVNKPYISTTFPTANTNFGLTLRFTLSQ